MLRGQYMQITDCRRKAALSICDDWQSMPWSSLVVVSSFNHSSICRSTHCTHSFIHSCLHAFILSFICFLFGHDLFVHLLLHTCFPLGQSCMILIGSLYEILLWRSGQEQSP